MIVTARASGFNPVVLLALAAIAGLPACPDPPAPPAVPDALCGISGITGAALAIPVGSWRMQQLCDLVYVEPGLEVAQHTALKQAHRTAMAEVTAAFGGSLRGPPVLVMFCRSPGCKEDFGAPPSAAAARDLGFARDGVHTASGFVARPMVVVTGPEEGTARILTHELVHAEMKAWVPYDSLPTWFNEGMATFLASEPRCPEPPVSPLPRSDIRSLDSKPVWQEFVAIPGNTLRAYCGARQEVSLWAARHGERRSVAAALQALLRAVAAGTSFAEAFDR
jgi:hypothetical protein